MKLTKKKDDNSTLRKIWNDEKTEVLAMVGTFKDLLDVGIVENVAQYSLDTWCCIPAPGRIERWRGIGATRDQAISNAIFGKKLGEGREKA